MTCLLKIKNILGYDVTFLRMTHLKKPFVNAYVRIPNLKKSNHYYETHEPFATYHYGSVIGIDTNHLYNWDMTFEQKEHDAERQIRNIIKYFKNKKVK